MNGIVEGGIVGLATGTGRRHTGAMNAPARKHHFLSQCYLKGFADVASGGKLSVVDLDRETTFATVPANVAAIRDFNRIDIPGVPIDQLERDYARFEDALAPVLRGLSESPTLPRGEGFDLVCQLMAMVAVRNPRFRAVQAAAMQQIIDLTAGAMFQNEAAYAAHLDHLRSEGVLKEGESRPDFATMKKIWDSGAITAEPNPTFMIGMEVSMYPMLIELMGARRWIRAVAPEDTPGFITCDHPVSLFWSDPAMRGGFYGPGFGMHGTEVMFAVSRRLALIGAFEVEDQEIVAGPELQGIVNGCMIASATSQVYAAGNDFEYQLTADTPRRRGSDLLGETKFLAHRKARKANSTRT